MRKTLMLSLAIATLAGVVVLSGCSRAAWGGMMGTGVGTASGAIIGHQSGHRTEGALIGGAGGGLLGYMMGNELDKHAYRQDRRYRDDYSHHHGWTRYETRRSYVHSSGCGGY